MEGREGERKDGRNEGGHSSPSLSTIVAPSVSYCNSYHIRIISATYFLVSCWMPSVDCKPHESRFHFHLITYEFPKHFNKYLANGQVFIPHLLRMMLPVWLGFVIIFLREPVVKHFPAHP